MKIRSGDQVVVITGKDKGKIGRVLRVLNNGRLVVSDANMRTKHVRGNANRPGQIIKYEASLDSSNVMLVDPKSNKRTRIGFETTEKGKKRIAKRSGEEVKAGKVPEKKELEKEKKAATSEKAVEDKKETKDTKETKEVKKKKEKKTERVDSPDKKAFWKGVKFGAEAMEESDDKDSSKRDDRPVSDQGKTPDTFTHKRGE